MGFGNLLFSISILFISMGVFTLPLALMKRNKKINNFAKKTGGPEIFVRQFNFSS